MGDTRVSARAENPTAFWRPHARLGVSDETIAAHEAQLKHEFPTRLNAWMQVQNGGAVRFRFLPPDAENGGGRMRPTPADVPWTDVFPDVVLPMEQWKTLAAWNQTRADDFGDALCQLSHSQTVEEEFGDPAMVIVLAEGPNRLTLLDRSREQNADNASLVQLARDARGWQQAHRSTFFGSMALRARLDEL